MDLERLLLAIKENTYCRLQVSHIHGIGVFAIESGFDNNYIFVKNYKVDGFYIHESLKSKVNINYENFSQIGKKQW